MFSFPGPGIWEQSGLGEQSVSREQSNQTLQFYKESCNSSLIV